MSRYADQPSGATRQPAFSAVPRSASDISSTGLQGKISIGKKHDANTSIPAKVDVAAKLMAITQKARMHLAQATEKPSVQLLWCAANASISNGTIGVHIARGVAKHET